MRKKNLSGSSGEQEWSLNNVPISIKVKMTQEQRAITRIAMQLPPAYFHKWVTCLDPVPNALKSDLPASVPRLLPQSRMQSPFRRIDQRSGFLSVFPESIRQAALREP